MSLQHAEKPTSSSNEVGQKSVDPEIDAREESKIPTGKSITMKSCDANETSLSYAQMVAKNSHSTAEEIQIPCSTNEELEVPSERAKNQIIPYNGGNDLVDKLTKPDVFEKFQSSNLVAESPTSKLHGELSSIGKAPSMSDEPISNRILGNQQSSKGISVAVVDANAIIHGDKLTNSADKFVTVSEVLDEVRDPISRQRLLFLPIQVDTMEPTPEALKKVSKFARETGDLQTLSMVDVKLIALTYTLESQIHGTKHLKESPPPIRMVNMRNLPEAEMPGWGKNVPNLAEWEALESLTEGDNLNSSSRILSVKDINFDEDVPSKASGHNDWQENGDNVHHRIRQYTHPKKEINIEGKKMVSSGIDASKGECDDNFDDWRPAVCRSTHRRYLRRKARRELAGQSDNPTLVSEDNPIVSIGGKTDAHSNCETENQEIEGHEYSEKTYDMVNEEVFQEVGLDPVVNSLIVDSTSNGLEGDDIQDCMKELDQLEISSQADGSVGISQADDASSEQSWALQSLPQSTVACVTSDFAMQNVLLQIGLRLLVPCGMQIRQLNRWVLKCHACNKVTAEIGRIFCPKCGNGGTLRKVSITVGENGVVIAARRPRIKLRGTKFSLPMPQGGREGITKNLILREDQLPKSMLHPRKKKGNKQDKDNFSADDIFSHCGEKKGPLKPYVGKTVAVLTGRRNPNDNHFSRKRL